jgi:muramoyltetrapeptide carboxypeptidase
MPETTGALLFLEDVGEAPYRIDRMLVQLEQAGVSSAVRGVALGIFRKCVPTDDEPSLTLAEVFADRFAARRAPCLAGLPFGHVAEQVTLPLGIRACIDTPSGEFALLETAVAER